MTENQALNWIETHTVTLVVKPHVTKLLCGMYVFTSTHPDISMRIIECVTQAKEGKIRQDAEPNNPPHAQR